MVRSNSRGRKPHPDSNLSAKDLYEVLGSSAAALKSLKPKESPVDEYNHLLLSHLVSLKSSSSSNPPQSTISSTDGANDLIAKLQRWETQYQSNKEKWVTPSARKRRRNNWIMTYNRALTLHASGDSIRAVQLCVENLKPVIMKQQKIPDELLSVASRMAFLLLESILTMSIGCHQGVENVDDGLSATRLVDWLDNLNMDKEPELKFLLALYKSRLDFQQRDESGKLMDSKIRSARKELKHAMEIFQHKLRPSGDAGSLEDSSSHSDENTQSLPATSASSNIQQQQQQQHIHMSRVLQGQNQAALNLKANTEQLKGNIKKSLILCGEAQTAVSEEEDASYEAMHANNLALVYETNGRRHLALHTISKALRADPPQSPFQRDGTARPDPTFNILYNSAICAAQAHKYIAAYECMAICVQNSRVMSKRPRCWLRLAEACIGLYAKRRKETPGHKFARVEVDGKSKGLMIQNGLHTNFEDNSDSSLFDEINLSPILASPEDLEQVKIDSLPRARFALETALQLFQEEVEPDEYGLASARLSMSYVSLATRDFRKALEFARLVLEGSNNTLKNNISQPSKERVVRHTMLQRQQATARMYASEASCALGDSMTSMRYLVGDGKDDAFDRLASELGGVTIEMAATNGDAKSRLARAQAMVRCSASAAYANLGNLAAARQLATSAQAMEDACSESRERSLARRALLYCMLREGNSGAALTLLRSVR